MNNYKLFSKILTVFALLLFVLLIGWSRPAAAFKPFIFEAACTGGVGSSTSLFFAVQQSNMTKGHDIIQLGENCDYRLGERFEGSDAGLPYITDDVTIEGQGAKIHRQPFDGSEKFRLISIGNINREVDVVLRDLVLENGEVDVEGGAFSHIPHRYDDGRIGYINLTLDNVTVQGNSAAGEGGGFYIETPGTVIINDSLFSKNKGQQGAGLFWQQSDGQGQLIMGEETGFSMNEAAENGGGLFAQGPTTLNMVNFFDNKASGDGGGAFIVSAEDGRIENGIFLRNESGVLGGGLRVKYSDMVIKNMSFTANKAGDHGGGLYAGGSITLDSNWFLGNQAADSGAAEIHLYEINPYSNELTAINNVFDQNSGGEAEDLFIDGDDIPLNYLIANNTFYGRGLDQSQALVMRRDRTQYQITNNIFSGYDVAVDVDFDVDSGLATTRNNIYYQIISSNESEDGVLSIDNIEADPLFLDAEHHVFELKEKSPAVDQGVDLAQIQFDFKGQPRPKGSGIDIGAYESPWTFEPEEEPVIFDLFIPHIRRNN